MPVTAVARSDEGNLPAAVPFATDLSILAIGTVDGTPASVVEMTSKAAFTEGVSSLLSLAAAVPGPDPDRKAARYVVGGW